MHKAWEETWEEEREKKKTQNSAVQTATRRWRMQGGHAPGFLPL